MEQLPHELVQHIFALSTPQRRKGLLRTNQATANGIRERVTVGVRDLENAHDFPPLPDSGRFPRLTSVRLSCTPAQLATLYGSPSWLEFGARDVITLCFTDLDLYRQTSPSTIIGVHHAAFNLGTVEDALVACAIIKRCQGLQSVVLSTEAPLREVPAQLTSRSVQKLTIKGAVEFAIFHLPELVTLEIDCILRRKMLKLYPCILFDKLQNVYIRVNRIHTVVDVCPGVRRLQIELTHNSAATILPIASLTSLSLTNVTADIDLEGFPELSTLTLAQSAVHGAGPQELLSRARRHKKLRYLVVAYMNPSIQDLVAWAALQEQTGANGFCEECGVSLAIRLQDSTGISSPS